MTYYQPNILDSIFLWRAPGRRKSAARPCVQIHRNLPGVSTLETERCGLGTEDFWLIFTPSTVTTSQRSSAPQLCRSVSWAPTPDIGLRQECFGGGAPAKGIVGPAPRLARSGLPAHGDVTAEPAPRVGSAIGFRTTLNACIPRAKSSSRSSTAASRPMPHHANPSAPRRDRPGADAGWRRRFGGGRMLWWGALSGATDCRCCAAAP